MDLRLSNVNSKIITGIKAITKKNTHTIWLADNLFIKQGSDGVYRIKNEKELISYLTSLTFPVEIDLVYKKICEISLGDINIYPEFCLKVTKYDTLKNIEGEDYLEYNWLDIDNLENEPLRPEGIIPIIKNGKFPQHKIFKK